MMPLVPAYSFMLGTTRRSDDLREKYKMEFDNKMALAFLQEMKEHQRVLDIDNSTLCKASNLNCDILLPNLKRWEAKLSPTKKE